MTVIKVIDSFDGKYRFLSNFAPCNEPIFYEGVAYATTEHAYQAAKTLDKDLRNQIKQCKHAGQAKRLGKKVPIRKDWDDIKLKVMADLLKQKFRKGSFLGHMLDSTGDATLIEGNTWGDTFWGVCNEVGTNYLGRLLMVLRQRNRE